MFFLTSACVSKSEAIAKSQALIWPAILEVKNEIVSGDFLTHNIEGRCYVSLHYARSNERPMIAVSNKLELRRHLLFSVAANIGST